MGLEAKTDGEKMIQLDSKIDKLDNKIDNVCESLDRVVEALNKLETTRVTDHEKRLTQLEKWQSEWGGAYKVIAVSSLILGVILATLKIFER